jgi:cadmium resistance protein CadD (predicted permease)
VATAGLTADIGVAAAAFVGTNIDNCVVTIAMVAGAPLDRARRIAVGQVLGFCVLVAAAAAAAALLFELSPAVVGLLGLVPLTVGARGLVGLRHTKPRVGRGDDDGGTGATRSPSRLSQRAVGRSLTAAALVTIGAGGDNLAAYIPLFRVGGGTNVAAIVLVFAVGEAALTAVVLWAGRHPRARAVLDRLGSLAVPVFLCAVGILVMVEAGTFSYL